MLPKKHIKKLSTFKASTTICDNKVAIIEVFKKKIPVYACGKGNPMLVVGPADLFRNNLLPKQLFNHFRVYFANLVSQDHSSTLNIDTVSLKDFIEAIESVRKQLNLEKIALFGHSANGILALKYSEKYPEHVLFNILVGTTPFRGAEKKAISNFFFANHASDERKKLYEKDQKKLTPNSSFVENYNASRAFNFYDPDDKTNQNIWKGVSVDEKLAAKYMGLVDTFDIRKEPDIIKKPVFLALGKEDFTCPYTLWLEYSQKILKHPIIYYAIIAKSAHYPMIENSNLFMKHLFEFLRKYSTIKDKSNL